MWYNVALMNIPVKRLKSGFEIPVYGLGMGGLHGTTAREDAEEIRLIQSMIECGITHIDTAELYASGHAEELLGMAIADFNRSDLLIATKAVSQNLTYDGIFRAVEGSLKRLKTSYIDLYMMHRFPEPGMPIRDTMRALDMLVEQGVVRHIGVSNFSVRRFDEAQKHTKNKIVCNQVHYNVQYREIEAAGILDYCQQNDVILTAWRPLQKGLLLDSPLLNDLAAKYHKLPAQVALNWLVSQDNVVTICRTSSLDHLRQNLGALDWKLDSEDIDRIRYEYPDQRLVSDLVPLAHPGSVAA